MVIVDEEGDPVRMFNVHDGYALVQAVRCGLKIAVISGGKSPQMQKRFEKLGVKDIYMGVSEKTAVFNDWMAREGLTAEETAYMGDDIPDLRTMRIAGLPCAPYDATHEARETASYVSRFNGGYGCVRDLIEQILRARGQWMSDDGSFVW